MKVQGGHVGGPPHETGNGSNIQFYLMVYLKYLKVGTESHWINPEAGQTHSLGTYLLQIHIFQSIRTESFLPPCYRRKDGTEEGTKARLEWEGHGIGRNLRRRTEKHKTRKA